jgi:hypothetical protein
MKRKLPPASNGGARIFEEYAGNFSFYTLKHAYEVFVAVRQAESACQLGQVLSREFLEVMLGLDTWVRVLKDRNIDLR